MEPDKFSVRALCTCQYQFLRYQEGFDLSQDPLYSASSEGPRRQSSGSGGLSLDVCWARCAKKSGEGKRYSAMGKGLGTLTPTSSNSSLFLTSHIQLSKTFVPTFQMAFKFIPPPVPACPLLSDPSEKLPYLLSCCSQFRLMSYSTVQSFLLKHAQDLGRMSPFSFYTNSLTWHMRFSKFQPCLLGSMFCSYSGSYPELYADPVYRDSLGLFPGIAAFFSSLLKPKYNAWIQIKLWLNHEGFPDPLSRDCSLSLLCSLSK